MCLKPIFARVDTRQNADVESFNCKLTPLNSTTLEKLRHILDHRCIVGGGEQIFLLSLGVSQRCNHNDVQACVFLKDEALYRVMQDRLFKKLTDCSLWRLLPAEISDLHVGREDAAALEEAGELQAGVAQRHAAQCGGRPGAEGRGRRSKIRAEKFRKKEPHARTSSFQPDSVLSILCVLAAVMKEVFAK